MSDDFFSDSGNKQAGRDPREYPVSDDWAFGKQQAPPSTCALRHRPPHVGAILLILAGVLFFLNNTGIVHIGSIFEYWPLILVAVGVSRLKGARGLTQVWSLVVIGIGVLFLTHNLGLVSVSFHLLWPIVLIGFGILLLAGRMGTAGSMLSAFPRMAHHGAIDEREVHLFAFFGGVKRVTDSNDFRGGEAVAVFGGVDIDLRLASMSGAVKEVMLDASALFGGVNIKVPDNWRVAVRGIGIFGGYEDKTLRRKSDVNPDSPLLIVTGYALFGGIEVKS